MPKTPKTPKITKKLKQIDKRKQERRDRYNLERRARYSMARSLGQSSSEARFSSNRRSSGESSRLADFRRWSTVKIGFPGDYQEKIEGYNRGQHKTRYDHYGYRRFYWEYVFDLGAEDVRKQLRDNDS